MEGDGDVDGELTRPLDHGVDPHRGSLEVVAVQAQVDEGFGEDLRITIENIMWQAILYRFKTCGKK